MFILASILYTQFRMCFVAKGIFYKYSALRLYNWPVHPIPKIAFSIKIYSVKRPSRFNVHKMKCLHKGCQLKRKRLYSEYCATESSYHHHVTGKDHLQSRENKVFDRNRGEKKLDFFTAFDDYRSFRWIPPQKTFYIIIQDHD